MAKTPDRPKSPRAKAPSSKAPSSKASNLKAPNSKASRPDVQPIGPALAELLNPAINRGDAGMGSGTGLQPPPDNSKDRRSGGEAAIHRARKSTPKDFPEAGSASPMPLRQNPQPPGARQGFEEAPQANYGTAATIPTLDPELAK